MARDSAEMQVGRIPSIINDILLTSSLSRNGDSNVHVFDNIVHGFSRKNCSDMPPLLLTEEDREELLRDRQNAMKCEETLARRKQEQYFDLVDKVQNVLRRIETKNAQKSNNLQGEKEIDNSSNASTKSPSDCNNNPSPKHLETYVQNMESFTSPKHIQRNLASSNFGESLNWERTRQPTGQRSNTGRYSLPADFETMYQRIPSGGSGQTNNGRHHTYSNVRRPLCAYSDHHVVYGNQDDRHFDGGGSGEGGGVGRHEQGSNYHTYLPPRPLSVMSDNQDLYGSANGYDSRPGQETLYQRWNQRPISAYTDNHTSYTNTSENIGNRTRQPDMPQKNTKSGHSYTTDHSSMIDNSSISQSSESHSSSISKQQEFLAMEQNRLEHHYAELQGQLLEDFQQRQQELIHVYNKSMETQSGGDQTMQSILEKSFESESEGTLMQSISEQGNFTLFQTDELPQSPFGINVKKSSTSFQNTDVGHNFQNSASRDLGPKKSSAAGKNSANSSNGRPKKSSRSFETSTSPADLLPNSTSSGARRVKSSSLFQNSAVSDQRFTKRSSGFQKYASDQGIIYSLQNSSSHDDARHMESSVGFQKSTSQDQRVKNTPVYSFQASASPDVGLARKSFNSEASAQDYYDIPRFGENTEKSDVVGGKSESGNKLDVEKGSGKSGMAGKNSRISTKNFGASVVTSPKRAQLSSFETQAMINIKITQSPKFFVVSAHAKGFLTRLLFQTAKINGLVTTMKDAKGVLADMNTESSQSITDRSFKERVKNQLQSAQSELRRIFVDSPPHVRMQILEQNRKLVLEKENRNANKVNSAGATAQNRPKLSNVTLKKRMSRQESQEKTPKSEKGGIPNSSKPSRGITVAKERNTPKSSTKSTPTTTTSTAKTTPKTKAKSGVTPVSDANASDTTKGSCLSVATEHTTNTTTTATVTSATTVVTKVANTKTGKKQDATKVPRNKPSLKSSKAIPKVTQNRRRTWDTGVLKPIQGRISPTIPTDKTRLSHEKRQSTMSTARNVGQKLLSEYQSNGLSGHSEGQSSTCEVSGIDMSKTYKVHSKPEQPVKKTGARRSLAANLSHK